MDRRGARRRMWAAAVGASIVLASCGGQVSPSGAASGVPATPSPAALPTERLAPASVAALPSPRPSVAPASATLRISQSTIRLPSGRSRSVALAIGSGILVCGGLRASGTTGSILRIDLPSGRVSQVGSLPSPVHDAGGSVLNGSGFIIGGGRFGPGATVQGVAGAGHGTTLGTLPALRADLVAVTVDGEIAVVGGGTSTFYDTRVLATTDGIHFRVVARLLVGVRYPAVAVLGGLVYVIGASTAAGDTTAIQSVDPSTGVVRIVGHLAHGLSHASAFVLNGAVLVAGGRMTGRAQDAIWRLTPSTGGVRQVGRLPYAVSDMAVAVVGTSAYLIGGEAAGLLASVITVTIQ